MKCRTYDYYNYLVIALSKTRCYSLAMSIDGQHLLQNLAIVMASCNNYSLCSVLTELVEYLAYERASCQKNICCPSKWSGLNRANQ